MEKIRLVDDALSGKTLSRPPLTLWYHFGVHHGPGEKFAELILDYFFHYDFDILKVMNDYYHPLPEGVTSLASAEDLEKISLVEVERTDWAEQLKALRLIRKRLEGVAYFVDTVFDPWHTLLRGMAGENLLRLAESSPGALHRALDVVTENLTRYSLAAIGEGAAGIFLSIPAGEEMVSRDIFLEFVRPYAERILSEVRSKAPLNIAHVHGERLFMEECLNLPAQVLNWWDRGPHGPSLPEVRERTDRVLMGGIDHTILPRHTVDFIRRHVREGMELGGREKFILAGGCSISSSLPPRAIRAVVEEARVGF
ncbi:MAG: hypothetical protein D6713_06635 [Deltaproteobacteria bacterium]|nr:MAG: hypothetical protein D6713_06635 [Deltaproteobacteria bacterium]